MNASLRDSAAAFLLSVVLHVIIAAVVGYFLGRWQGVSAVPEFTHGLSSIELSVVSTRPVPEPQQVKPVEAVPEALQREEDPVQEHEDPVVADPGVQQSSVTDVKTDVRPVYPLGSRIRGEEGIVRIKVFIDANGRADTIEIVDTSGYRALDASAVKALRRAKFRGNDGQLIRSVEAIIPFRFQLVDKPSI